MELIQEKEPQLSRLMESKLVLYGASGHCKVIMDILKKKSVIVDYIVDDNPEIKSLNGEIVSYSKDLDLLTSYKLILAIGNNKNRKKISQNLNVAYSNAVHPTAILSESLKMKEGTVIMAGVIVNADTVIGKHCIINTGSLLEHDCKIDDFVHISPRVSLAGNVEVGEGTQVGIGATIIQGIKIGKWVTIGAGSVIIKDIPDYAVVVGNPGRIIKYNAHNE